MQKYIQYKPKFKKRTFLVLGLLNFFVTNIILQISLLFMPIVFSTSLSFIINILIGYYLYGKLVFDSDSLNIKKFKKYFFIAFLLWLLNYLFIKSMFLLGFNKNLSAIFIIPFLVLISYFSQKNYVFKK
jgi:hypothetical protein